LVAENPEAVIRLVFKFYTSQVILPSSHSPSTRAPNRFSSDGAVGDLELGLNQAFGVDDESGFKLQAE